MPDGEVVFDVPHLGVDYATVMPLQPPPHHRINEEEEACLGRNGVAVAAERPIAFFADERLANNAGATLGGEGRVRVGDLVPVRIGGVVTFCYVHSSGVSFAV